MKIMAIDYGDAHTGIAISDYTETLAGHSEVLHSRKQEEVLVGIRRLIAEHDVKLLVLGYPRNMDGSEGPRAEKCAAFGELLRQETGLEVILWDERRTTIDAHNILFQNGQNAKKRKKTVDAAWRRRCLRRRTPEIRSRCWSGRAGWDASCWPPATGGAT